MSLRDLLRSLTSRPAHARPFVPTNRLWKRGVGAAAAAVLVSTALVAQGGVTTSASWNDAEWVHAPTVGTLDCTDPTGIFTTASEGRMLSGSLLGASLDQAAKVSGVRVLNDGAEATPIPIDASEANTVVDAYRDPLNATALGIVNTELTGFLQVPVDTPTGLIGQYAQAQASGDAIGASGTITDSGAVDLDAQASGTPGIATLQLSSLLDSLGYDLGALVSEVTDVSLEIGAVAGQAVIEDTCANEWTSTVDSAVQRQYLAAGLDTVVTTPATSTLTSAVNNTVSEIESQLNDIVGSSGLLSGVTTNLVGLLTNALNLVTGLAGARLDSQNVKVSLAAIDIDRSSLDQFLTTQISDSSGVLSLDLASSTVRIDTAALLGSIRGDADGTTLNGLPPNTNLLTDPQVLPALEVALTNALDGWIASVNEKLVSALDLATITVDVSIPFQKCSLVCLGNWTDAGKIQATISGTLAQLLNNSATIVVDTTALNLGLVGSLLTGVVNAVTGVVTKLLAPLIGAALQEPLNGVRQIAHLPIDSLQTLPIPIVGSLQSLLTVLFNSEIVSITVNAQNAPLTGFAGPSDWEAPGFPLGQFEVAAIRVGILDLLQTGPVTLYLGRGSVGPVCTIANITQPGSRCTGY